MTEIQNPTLYIFINKSLNMSSGKVAAQSAHAAAYSIARTPEEDNNTFWLNYPHKTIIVFEARDEAHLRNIRDYLRQRGVGSDLIIDEGANEVPSHSATALVTTMLDKNDMTNKLMSTFTLYSQEPEKVYIYANRFQPIPHVFYAGTNGIARGALNES